jgi:prepilin-type N-terminal cleavage/methylation domain-containing protein
MSSIRSDRRGRRNGFSLIELLVAITITAILATVLFQLLVGQGKLTSLSSAQQEVQQNARGALEIIAADLRATPSGGISQAAANSVTMKVPKAFGIICSSAVDEMYAAFPVVPSTTIPTGTVDSPMGVFKYDSITARWDTADVAGYRSTVTQVTYMGTSHAACNANLLAGTPAIYRFQGSHFPVGGAGTLIAPFDVVQYSVATSAVSGSSDPLWVVRGNTASGSNQPLAGPVPSTSSLQFRFYRTTTGSTAIGATANPDSVKRVTVVLTTRNRYRRDIALSMTDSVTVFLRNQ